MSDTRRDTEAVVLDGPRPLGPALPAEVIAAIAAIRRRRKLETSEVFRRHEAEIDRVTGALVHLPAASQPVHPSAGPGLRVASWNIQRGIHLEGIKRYLVTTPELQGADVLMLNEVDLGMSRSGNLDIAAELAGHLGLHMVFGNSYLCLDYGDLRDGTPQGRNRESMHGNAILSRYPIRRAENVSVAPSRDKFHSSEKRLGHKKALWAEIDTPAGPLPVAAAHLDSYGSSAQRAAQLRDLLQRIDEHGLGERVLVGGDFNTTTYDAKSIPRLIWNLVLKLWRGGFPHAIHSYVHPYEIYEKVIFDVLREHRFEYEPFNAMGVGTTRYEVGTYESESKVTEMLPGFAVKILRWKLKPWNGVAPLKIDWFAGRGLQPLGEAESSLAPTVLARPSWEGTLLSDHDPIVVDLDLGG